MSVVLLSVAAREAEPLHREPGDGLAQAGIAALLIQEPGEEEWRGCVAGRSGPRHWLRLWGRPPYASLAKLAGRGAPGGGLRRWLEPALNSVPVFARRRQRFLERFFAALEAYQARGGRVVDTVHNLAQHEGEGGQIGADGHAAHVDAGPRPARPCGLHGRRSAAHPGWRRGPASRPRPWQPRPWARRFPGQASPLRSWQSFPTATTSTPTPTPSAASPCAAPDLPQSVHRSPCTAYLFLGLIRPYKGLEEWLAASLSQLARSGPRACWWPAGRGRPGTPRCW